VRLERIADGPLAGEENVNTVPASGFPEASFICTLSGWANVVPRYAS
jgi:hypothetical protein